MKIVINHHGELAGWMREPGDRESQTLHIVCVSHADEFEKQADADAFIDMQFDGIFYAPTNVPYFINETVRPFQQLENVPPQTARFCGWDGFCERRVWELATNTVSNTWLDPIMYSLGKQFEIVADMPGLVAPRIISMIINEAYYALADGTSTAEGIDMAMKLGTNYPDGPISWSKKIGLQKISELLMVLQQEEARYSPHPLLQQH